MNIRSRHWLWLLLVVPVALGFWRLRFDVEILNLLPPQSQAVQGLRLYQENFANARELIVTVRGADATQAESAAHAIADALRGATNLVTAAHWQAPWQEHPGQAAELIAFLWFNQPPRAFAELPLRLTDAALSNALTEAREQLATSLSPEAFARRGYDPFNLTRLPEAARAGLPALTPGQDSFASVDGAFRVVFIEAASDLAGYRACAAWLAQVKQIVKAVPSTEGLAPPVEIGFTGRPAFVAEIASGMERDMFGSVGSTLLIIAGLFAWVHRRWQPLAWIVTLLVLILAATMAFGGLIYGAINVVSMGFAAILLGLGVDYGLVLYQEALAAPHQSPGELRREVGPGIVWSAVTTAGAFLLLNLSSLPGLAQLGTLVAIGVTLAAVVMLFAYLPPLARILRVVKGALSTLEQVPLSSPTTKADQSGDTQAALRPLPGERASVATTAKPLLLSAALGLTALALFLARGPTFDNSTAALRPKHSAAYAALDEIKIRIARMAEPLWLFVPGHDEREVAQRLELITPALEQARAQGRIAGFTLPSPLWPNPDHQSANHATLADVLARRTAMREAALAAGFTTNSLALAEGLFNTWRQALDQRVFWPTNEASRWVLDKFIAQPARQRGLRLPLRWAERTRPNLLALGLIYPATNPPPASTGQALLPPDSFSLLSGWRVLGEEVFALVRHEVPRLLAPMIALLLVSLGLAFRRAREVLLSLGCVAFSGLLLHGVMALAGWSWNLMNLLALPLLLGAGVDYSIHMQLALRRHGGDTRIARRTVGRALFLCAATTVAGFGSTAFSSNAGLASLGQVCAVGVACAYIVAVGLLPGWWNALERGGRGAHQLNRHERKRPHR